MLVESWLLDSDAQVLLTLWPGYPEKVQPRILYKC